MGSLARIRAVIARIPRGRVATYGRVAEIAGFPRAARLTVRALQGGALLPWHRVVAVGGRIALPGVEGEEQRLRLRLEGVRFRGERVRMDLHEWRGRRATPRPAARTSESRR
jgi:methylated-DNA-protein-cysteine methyltransferase-like protein